MLFSGLSFLFGFLLASPFLLAPCRSLQLVLLVLLSLLLGPAFAFGKGLPLPAESRFILPGPFCITVPFALIKSLHDKVAW